MISLASRILLITIFTTNLPHVLSQHTRKSSEIANSLAKMSLKRKQAGQKYRKTHLPGQSSLTSSQVSAATSVTKTDEILEEQEKLKKILGRN